MSIREVAQRPGPFASLCPARDDEDDDNPANERVDRTERRDRGT
ncbi:hypothetical protein AB0H42_17375 [Nocardia sp. NPDC050799]